MATNQELLDSVLDKLETNGIQNVRFEFLDLCSVARSKTIPARHFKRTTTSGILFPITFFACDPYLEMQCESKIWKKYTTADTVFYPDLSTFTILPWSKDTARVFVSASSIDGGDDVRLVDPRNILQAQLQDLAMKDLSILSAIEYEFWLVDEKTRVPINPDINGYSTLQFAKHQEFLSKIALNLFEAGVDVNCSQVEYGKGMFEITMEPSFGMKAADTAATLRTGVKEMSMQNGMIGSFMSKPFLDAVAASGHLNHSLWSPDGKTSKLSDPSRPHGLSDIGEHWIAGLLDHAPALSFLQAPTLNCLQRINISDIFVPTNASWGINNRTCAVRIKKGGSDGMYFENRLGSSAGNPYISLAATIAAGLDGINRELRLPPAVPIDILASDEGNVPAGAAPLPRDLESALKVLKNDEVMMNAMGTDFVDALECVRRSELKKVKGDKYAWARQLYFDYI
ncbi:lengsin-like [Apostichopus japonicus]|uniref:lengsin-like n=1 Tax=Stichopus japonicus TaxID=307972 RepID=UPI003AB684DF